jgi:thioesterase domain-containing protein
VPIQTKGAGSPFFCVHGAGGNVLLYRELFQSLGESRPLYGLQSQGLDGHSPFLTTIEEMAALYVREVREVQPQGPYHLGGYCVGGTIAFAMAQLLLEAGQEVAFLALLDTYNFSRTTQTSPIKVISQKLRFHLGNFTRLNPREGWNYVTEKVRVARDGELANLFRLMGVGGRNLRFVTRSLEASVTAVNDAAGGKYAPRPYPGRLTLFKPRANYDIYPDPKFGWGDLALGGIDIVELPVNPHAMLVEPYVQVLGDEIKKRLENTESGDDSSLVAADSVAG